jgi:predicted O-methyltransferase YrrM
MWAPQSPVSEAEWRSWFVGKELTTDWLGGHVSPWFVILEQVRNERLSVLEVGAFEGRSVITFLRFLPQSTVMAVDLFPFADIEARFDRNVLEFGSRVTKRRGPAAAVLEELAQGDTEAWSETRAFHAPSNPERFDIIYLDAAKTRQDAFIHSTLAWPLLKMGGLIIWDDYRWRPERPDDQRPHNGIKLFCQAFAGCYSDVHAGYQLVVQKTRRWPAQQGPRPGAPQPGPAAAPTPRPSAG